MIKKGNLRKVKSSGASRWVVASGSKHRHIKAFTASGETLKAKPFQTKHTPKRIGWGPIKGKAITGVRRINKGEAITVGKNFGFWFDNEGDSKYDEIYGEVQPRRRMDSKS